MNDETKSPQIKNKSTIKNRIALAKTSLTIGSILALLGGWVALAKAEPSVIGAPAEAMANQPSTAVQPQSNARNRPGAPQAPAVQGLPTRPSVSNGQANTQPEAARGSVVATPVPQATQAARPTAVAPTATPRAAVAAQPAPQARAQSSQRPAPSTRTRSSR